jgi:hypothetical protein
MTDTTEHPGYSVWAVDNKAWQAGFPLTTQGLTDFMVASKNYLGWDDQDLAEHQMDQGQKEKWLTLLREPGAKQTRGHLTVLDSEGNRSDCCWGLWCTALGLPFSDRVVEDPTDARRREYVLNTSDGDGGDEDSIGDDFAQSQGLHYGVVQGLECANDAGFSFVLIAGWVEEHL